MKKIFFLISLFSFSLLLTGCGTPSDICIPDEGLPCGTETTTTSLDLSGTIDAVLLHIKNMDLLSLSAFVGTEGLRFSPYEYIDIENDIVFTKDQVANGLALSRTFTRGTEDGSGFPIDLGIAQYRERYVYDADFVTAPEIYYNQKFSRGNTLNTIFDVYTNKEIVEYYFPQIDPQYEGIDWRSLYLILDNVDGQRYLIGIAHGAWTI